MPVKFHYFFTYIHVVLNLYSLVWTEEAWLQKYANAEDAKETTEEKKPTETEDSDNEDNEDEKEPAATRSSPTQGGKSRVFLDIQIGSSLAGRVEIEV